MTKTGLKFNDGISRALLQQEVGHIILRQAEVRDQQITAEIVLKRRPWIKRCWRFPRTWRQIYLIARKDDKRLLSLKLSFMLACLTLKRY